jgi:hypothetical protein
MKTDMGCLETLSPEDLDDIGDVSTKDNIILSGYVDFVSKHLILFRGGDRKCYVVPFEWFEPSANCSPNFEQFSIIDCGTAIKLGEYEAGVNNIFKEFSDDTVQT